MLTKNINAKIIKFLVKTFSLDIGQCYWNHSQKKSVIRVGTRKIPFFCLWFEFSTPEFNDVEIFEFFLKDI